ncbi:MAG: glucan 1,3-beta-glucosidase [Patiriisocius sp.]|jgi:glucan 1,3-beta-glucosidase
MSYREGQHFSLNDLDVNHSTGADFTKYSSKDLEKLWRKTLKNGMHGLCFSLYEDGQKPGDIISEEQVRRRMEIIKPYTKWVRTFSCTDGNEFIPKIAKEYGIKTLVGAWLGDDPEINEREVEGLIQLANEGFVDIAAVGNEVLYRNDLSEDEIIEFMNRVKEAIPEGIPIGYVDAYYEFTVHPRITELCDVILANCYPYWEGCPMEYSLGHMQEMFGQASHAANGKKVIITETGWPSQGTGLKGAMPSGENAMKYFINAQVWSAKQNIEMFYFSSFDESWKVGPEGDVGAYWGLWDKHEKLKF